MTNWYIGLMSGTSLDGVDAVLADLSPDAPRACRVAGHTSLPMPAPLRAELLQLNTSGDNELHRAALAANALVRLYAQAVEQLLQRCSVTAGQVAAIGVHGQTVRHRPGQFDGTGYTLQLNNPALLAELTGITTVADFRSRDVAAGGQGAPLVPAFHQCVFGQAGRAVGVLNIGGIANLSVLSADGSVLGFDCGPGNALMDYWVARHRGALYDEGGRWAASGQVLPTLLTRLLAEPYLHQRPPKSTGRDLFNPDWLGHQLKGFEDADPADVQATLAQLTARASADAALAWLPAGSPLIVCGGGALNQDLLQRLAELAPQLGVQASDSHGLAPLQVEAAAFAWLARRCLQNQAGNLPQVTGAAGPRVLGAIYPR